MENGHIKKTDLFRAMSPNQVQAKILQLFSIDSFEYLKVDGRNLSVGINQLLNGDEVIESAIKRKGHTMYIRKKSDNQVPSSESRMEPSVEEVYMHLNNIVFATISITYIIIMQHAVVVVSDGSESELPPAPLNNTYINEVSIVNK